MLEILQYVGSALVILILWVGLTIQIGNSCISEHYSFTRYQTYNGNYAHGSFYCGCIGQVYGVVIVGSVYLVAISLNFLMTR